MAVVKKKAGFLPMVEEKYDENVCFPLKMISSVKVSEDYYYFHLTVAFAGEEWEIVLRMF